MNLCPLRAPRKRAGARGLPRAKVYGATRYLSGVAPEGAVAWMTGAGGAVEHFASALAAADEDGAVHAMVAALRAGVPVRSLERAMIKAMAGDGEELHSMIYVSAAFDMATLMGPEAGKYALAAAASQIARQPKNSNVAKRVAGARAAGGRPRGIGEVERALAGALDDRDVGAAVDAAVELHRQSRDGAFVIELFGKWAGTPEVIERPAGYVSHLPLQIDAALNLLKVTDSTDEVDLLLGHLAYCQVELSRRYTTRRIASSRGEHPDQGEALAALRLAVHGRRLEELDALMVAASPTGRKLDEPARVLLRCALEAEGGLSHRFTLASAAWRTARMLHPAVGRALLHHAALSIANGYEGPRKLAELRDLPHPNPGGQDYAGRLLVGLASGNLAEAHAALRGLFESGASPRTAVAPFMDAASQLDAHHLHTDHGFILTQAAWRALADGSLAGDAVPLLAELATRIAKAPKDHDLIARVEEASERAARAPA